MNGNESMDSSMELSVALAVSPICLLCTGTMGGNLVAGLCALRRLQVATDNCEDVSLSVGMDSRKSRLDKMYDHAATQRMFVAQLAAAQRQEIAGACCSEDVRQRL